MIQFSTKLAHPIDWKYVHFRVSKPSTVIYPFDLQILVYSSEIERIVIDLQWQILHKICKRLACDIAFHIRQIDKNVMAYKSTQQK